MDPVSKCSSDVAAEWTNIYRFCSVLDQRPDPDELLKSCHAPTFKAYLVWRCKNSRIRKTSSITTYWKVLCMHYCDKTLRWMDGGVLHDVGNVRLASSLRQSRLG
jgi:hypothetical protein